MRDRTASPLVGHAAVHPSQLPRLVPHLPEAWLRMDCYAV